MSTAANFFTPLQEDGGALTTQLLAAIKAILTDPTFNTVTVQKAFTALTVAANSLNLTNPKTAITAHAGGGQANAVALQLGLNQITTVATGDDSVKLPASAAGNIVVVINAAAANSADVYPATGEAINALAANAEFTLAANKVVIFFCAVAGTWNSLLTA